MYQIACIFLAGQFTQERLCYVRGRGSARDECKVKTDTREEGQRIDSFSDASSKGEKAICQLIMVVSRHDRSVPRFALCILHFALCIDLTRRE